MTENTLDDLLVKLNATVVYDDQTLGDSSLLSKINALTTGIKLNKKAVDKKLTFFRFKSKSLLETADVFSLDDLTAASYHAVIDGKVVKEGTFKIQEKDPVISREELIRVNETELFPETALGREFTRSELLPTVSDLYRAHVDYWGWFYPQVLESDLKGVLGVLATARVDGKAVSVGTSGSVWLKSYVKSFWDVDKGPSRAFHEGNKLNSVLKYRLGLNNSKPYEYDLSDGTHVSCRETFDINLKNVRFGFIVQRSSVSWFRPQSASSVYRHFLSSVSAPVVWDPSVGFSARLLGFAAACPGGTYIGTDPAEMMCSDASRLGDLLKDRVTVEIRQEGSEKATFEPESLDFVFTSPPYFDKERYVDEPGQCWRDHPSLEEWVKGYLIPTFEVAQRALKPGCLCVFNVFEELAAVVEAAGAEAGLKRRQDLDLYMPLQRDHFHKKTGHDDVRKEPFIVFEK